MWKSLLTSYPPGTVEVFEREASERDGNVPERKEEVIAAAVAVGKWESRWGCGIPKRSGFSTAFSPAVSLLLKCAGHDACPLFRSGA